VPTPSRNIDQRLKQFTEACRSRGVSVTHQRTEIFWELAGTDEHPDAEAVFRRVRKRIPAVSLDTVYRTLQLLEQLGVARRVDPTGDRARFDGNIEPHHHFVCTECGLVRDFQSRALDRFPPPRKVAGWGQVDLVQVQLRGICMACGKKKRTSKRKR